MAFESFGCGRIDDNTLVDMLASSSVREGGDEQVRSVELVGSDMPVTVWRREENEDWMSWGERPLCHWKGWSMTMWC